MRIVWDSVKYFTWRGFLYGALLATLWVSFGEGSNPGAGLILGAPFGAVTGIFTGFFDGLMIGILCRLMFNPVRHPKRFRWVITAFTALVTYAGALFFLLILLPLALSGRAYPPSWDTLMFMHQPILLAVIGMVYTALNFVKHYLGITEPKPMMSVVLSRLARELES